MKPFQVWVSDLANSIPDPYAHIQDKPKESKQVHTALQKRALLADLLVPNPSNIHQIDDWISVFTVCLSSGDEGERKVRSGWLYDLVGDGMNSKYLSAVTVVEIFTWFKELRSKIESVELK